MYLPFSTVCDVPIELLVIYAEPDLLEREDGDMDSRGNCGGDSSSGDGDEDDVESAAEVAAVAAGMIEAAEETLKEDGDGPVLTEDGEDAEAGAGPSSAAESLWEPMVRHYIHMNLKARFHGKGFDVYMEMFSFVVWLWC